jgi:hypothetical protein
VGQAKGAKTYTLAPFVGQAKGAKTYTLAPFSGSSRGAKFNFEIEQPTL